MALSNETRSTIEQHLEENDIVLFMKGNRRQPRCGFSSFVVRALEDLGVNYKDVDVLKDDLLRDGIKEYGNWPTIPQLYYKKELIGGSDIVREMTASGELAKLFGVDQVDVSAPKIEVSERALAEVKILLQKMEHLPQVRIQVLDRARAHEVYPDQAIEGDFQILLDGITFLMDKISAKWGSGIRLDLVELEGEKRFVIENPNSPPEVKPLSVFQLRAWMDAELPIRLYDVRTEKERAFAFIEGSVFFDESNRLRAEMLPKNSLLVFQCHHGGRSQKVAEQFVKKGFTHVYNLTGGIDAWSSQVDSKVPRY